LKIKGLWILGLLALVLVLTVACAEDNEALRPAATSTAIPGATSPVTDGIITSDPTPTTPVSSPHDAELVAQGEEIFLNTPDNSAPQALWCSQCHLIEGVSVGAIGPELTHIGTEAAGRKPSLSAEEYIRESIVNPEVFLSEGFTAGLMTNAITGNLTDEQVGALVAYLWTLK
jgi:mono/diheme cytochrome c family protein